MAATIKIKNSSTAGAAPTASDLVQGELAVNVTDKRLFTENSGGTVVELGTNPSSITLPDGSASAPTLLHSGDTNTGLFFPAADTIALTTGGSERLRLDSSGNLGLGVTPSAWTTFASIIQGQGYALAGYSSGSNVQSSVFCNVYYNGGYKYQSSAAATQYLQISGQHQWFNAASGTAGNAITFTQAMTLDASGNLGIGTTSPQSYSNYKILHVAGPATNGSGLLYFTNSNNSLVGIANADGANSLITFGSQTNHPIRFATNDTERARIDTSGNLLVGTTATINNCKGVYSWDSASNNGVTFNDTFSSAGTGIAAYFRRGGSNVGSISTTLSATAYNTSSDYRLKENIQPMVGALAKVAALKPCTYTWKADGSEGEGFIAHELAEVCPHAVTGIKDATEMEQYEISPAVPATYDEEGNELTPAVEAVIGEREVPKYQGIDTSFLVATLTAAIQEQQAIITQLQADVAALKGQA